MKFCPLHFLAPAAMLLSGCGLDLGGSGFADCEAAANSGNGVDAIARCTEVIDSKAATDRQRAYAYSYRAGALQATGKPGDVMKDLDESVRLAPKDATMIANRGAIHSMRGELDLAQRDLEAAVKLDPKNVLALGNVAILHSKRGEWPQAREMVERALAIEPRHVALRGELCWIGAASAANAEAAAAALPVCDEAIALSDNANNFNSRGLANFRAGKFFEAIADYERSLEGDPGVGSSWYMRGMSRRAAGVEGAQEDIDKGLELEPGVAQRYAGYGVTPP